MQYSEGAVSVSNGSATVTGSGTTWVTDGVAAGMVFTIAGSGVSYQVASVSGETSLALTANYGGASASGQSYVINAGYTTNRKLPYPEKGDIETATLIKDAMLKLDELGEGSDHVEDSITAHAGGGKASAYALSATKNFHRVSTVATAADSVLLPAALKGRYHYVRHDGANAMQVFGQSSDTINGVATATGISQSPDSGVLYVCTTDGAWTSTPATFTGTGSVMRAASPTTTGTLTAAAVTVSTLSASGTITSTKTSGVITDSQSATTGLIYHNINNTSGNLIAGVDSSTGGTFTGSAAYSTILGNAVAKSLHLATNGAVGITLSSGQNTTLAGTLTVAGHGTTASAANAYIDSGTGLVSRSTSSVRYKRDIEPLAPEYADKILDFEPIWYRSTSDLDNAAWSWYGFGAEQVAELDPRFVHWRPEIIGWNEALTEEVEVEEPVMQEVEVTAYDVQNGRAIRTTRIELRQVIDVLPVFDAAGAAVMVPDEHGQPVQQTVHMPRMRKVKQTREISPRTPIYGDPVPDGVQYERLTVPLIALVKQLRERIAALEAAAT